MSAPNKNYDPKATASLAPDEVARVLDEALTAVAAAGTLDELKAARIAHEGDRAPLSLASAEIGALPPEARAEAGRRVGAARSQLREAIRERQVKLEAERDRQVLITEAVDVTLPGGRTPAGARHPVTSLGDRLSDVFVAMGYEVAEGPEVEAEWYNFDALNMLPDHPARDAQDTIFIQSPAGPGHKSGMVLRTQTSPVQIRSMLNRPLPLYVVSPGRTYRHDPLDATHSPIFHQIEGLAVDEGCSASGCARGSGRTTSPSPNRPATCRWSAISAGALRSSPAATRAGCAGRKAGSRSRAAAWSTPGCWWPAVSIPTGTAGSRSGSASSAA
jgi:phenylalanyl-tRNA synthetase alpha chain